MPVAVLLIECFLAGFQYHQAARHWAQLAIGEELNLVREPGNPHDTRAVRVDWHGDAMGYIPREANYAVAQMLDRGVPLRARIAGKRPDPDPKTRIRLEVFVFVTPISKPLDERSDADIEKVIQKLGWILAKRTIDKAKGAPANR